MCVSYQVNLSGVTSAGGYMLDMADMTRYDIALLRKYTCLIELSLFHLLWNVFQNCPLMSLMTSVVRHILQLYHRSHHDVHTPTNQVGYILQTKRDGRTY
jgi:hypothetical protein